MLAAVSSSDAACCSVREERSLLPAEISLAPVKMVSVLSRTVLTVRASACCIS